MTAARVESASWFVATKHVEEFVERGGNQVDEQLALPIRMVVKHDRHGGFIRPQGSAIVEADMVAIGASSNDDDAGRRAAVCVLSNVGVR